VVVTVWTDIRFAVRTFAKNPGFTVFAVLTLALGLGANVAIFSFLDGVLLKRLPYPEPEQIVQIWEKPPQYERNGVSALNFLDWKEQATAFQFMAARTGDSVTLTGHGEPIQLRATRVTASYFDVLGIKAASGRTFAADEDQPGRDRVAVISHRLWQTTFGGRPDVLTRTIVLNGDSHSIVGVMPEGSEFDRSFAEIWLPLVLRREAVVRNFHFLNVIARLKPGMTVERAQTEMSGIAGRIAELYPDIKKGWGARVDRLVDRVVGNNLRTSLYVLMAAVGAVLLIGCANLANLLLARGAMRGREMAVRVALGARRGRLVQQLLTESLLLSMLGAAAGLALGYGLFHLIRAFLPRFYLPSQATVGIDWRVMLFVTALAIVTGVLFGLAPAFDASRRDGAEVLKEGGRGTFGSRRKVWLRHALVISEVALAFVLLVGAGLLIRSFNKLMQVDTGFNSVNIVTMNVPLIMGRDTDGARLTMYLDQIVERVNAVPGVRHAALTSALPMQGWGFGMPFWVEGTSNEMARRPATGFKMVTPGYFRALGMRLRKGRELTAADVKNTTPVMVINETFASKFFKQRDPIGQHVMVEQIITGKRELGPEISWEVVGIVADEKTGSLDSSSEVVYVPYAQSPIVGVSLLVKGAGEPATFTKAVQQAVWEVNKNQALDNVRTLEEIKSESVGSTRLQTFLLGLFATLALLLAAIGIYGVISYVTAQRTQELGVRAALGASSWELMRLVVSGALLPVGVGIALGAGGALLLTRVLRTLLFETSPWDPTTMIAVGVMLTTVALTACYVPARRASRIDPMLALRHE
jgi:putative ABC transport system permease protein